MNRELGRRWGGREEREMKHRGGRKEREMKHRR